MNNSKKNKETMISENFEKSLKDWKLPPSSASDIYHRNGIFNNSRNYRVKSEEAEIPISDEYSSFTLFSNDLKMTYREFYFLHLGMVQVGLKPTKLGSTKSAIICLSNKTTILSMVESSLSEGPIYFSHFSSKSRYDISLSDPDLATSLTLDIKINGSNSSEEEKVILMFRFHYNAMKRENARLRIGGNFVYKSGKTTLCVTKVAQSNRVVSSQIYWDTVSIPERWLAEDNLFSEWQRARVDWKEVAEAHVLKVDVPGFNEEEVKVEVEDGCGILRISGERSEEGRGEEGDKWYRAERGDGKFLRRLRLPENARLDELTAGLEKGVLTVTVPKEKVSRKLQVKISQVD